jgi:hypothetical protein
VNKLAEKFVHDFSHSTSLSSAFFTTLPSKIQKSGNPTLIPLKEEKRKGKKFLERKKVPPV